MHCTMLLPIHRACSIPAYSGDVDHFIAWSRYPRDTAHNFVLAHASCNGQKGDRLADRRHLERWLERNAVEGSRIGETLAAEGFSASLEASTRIAQWAYEQRVVAHAHGWVLGDSLEAIDRGYLECFGEGRSDW